MTATVATRIPATASEAAQMISSRTALPAGMDARIAREATAIVLARAAKAIAPQTPKGQAALNGLVKLEALAGLPGAIVRPWLMLRSLAPSAGAQVSFDLADLADPIVAALVHASGVVATTDPDATVRGVFGSIHGGSISARPIENLMTGGRIATMTAKGELVVSNGVGQLLAVDLDADRDAALAAIDALSARQASGSTRIGPIAYNVADVSQPTEFAAAVFTTYRISRIDIPGAVAHPTPLVESAALASVRAPAPSYKPFFHNEILAKGILSDVQIEAVVYAGEAHSRYLNSNPDNDQAAAPRQGMLIGHGTGVGKGRIITGVMADNWSQGRRRHIWISESARLIEDARRDWVALGGKADEVVDIRGFSADAPIPPFSGILFSTYASLRGETENGSRQKQIAEWFGAADEGVIAFDEAQNLRNARSATSGWSNASISRQGAAANNLQAALPNARVLYVSATSASDIASMGFAVRLGLWGRGTAFANARRFFQAMDEGGVNALEMVARDLKAMGLYFAANLSFEGVSYDRLERQLTAQERATQDRLADIWSRVNAGLNRALITTGIANLPAKTTGKTHKLGQIFFSMSRARFFQAVLAAMKTPMLIESIREDLRKGYAPIIQMTNTFAANADRAIEEAEEAGKDVGAVEATPRDILIGYLRDQFPTVKHTVSRSGGKLIAVAVLDPATGAPMECPIAAQVRDALIAEVEQIDVPEGPLEQLMDAFGPDLIAEVTGRRRRLIPSSTGAGRVLEERLPTDPADDVTAFMDDAKSILVFSTAGATGATYSAAKTVRNQRLRRHYLLQPGWRADLALQGMGRSHRSNQAQPPEFVLLTTDLWSDRRMISAVAAGMRSLGALTRGLRQAASQDFFTSDDNLEDEFGEAAWVSFVHKMANKAIPGLSIGQFEKEAGVLLRQPRTTTLVKPLPPVRRFLNAMSAMSCQHQALFGNNYRAELEGLKLEAIQNGSYDRGIETIQPDSLIKLEDAVIHRDPRTGGETRLLKMLRTDTLEPISYDDARRKALTRGNTQIAKSSLTGRIAILAFPRMVRGSIPSPTDKVEVTTPTGSRLRTRLEVVMEGWVRVDIHLAEQLWEAELVERGDEDEQTFWVITGAMLPIWDKLPRTRTAVYRMETDEGEQIIGRLVGDSFVDTLLSRVDALTGGGLGLAEVREALDKGGLVNLVNGWTIEGRINAFTKTLRTVLTLPTEDATDHEAIFLRINMKETMGIQTTERHYVTPTDETERTDAIAEILAIAPAASAAVF